MNPTSQPEATNPMSLSSLCSAWNYFWFARGSPLPVALFRILIGVAVTLFSLLFSPEAATFFGQHAIVARDTTAHWMHCPELNILSFFPADDIWLHGMLILLTVSGISLMLGLFPRISALICYLIILSLDSRNHFVLHTGDKIMCVMLLYLAISRCGEALSVRNIAGIRHACKPAAGSIDNNGSIFAQRLIQVQLAIVYWGAFSWKLHGNSWIDGSAVYYAAHLEQFQRFHLPYIFDHLWTCRLLSWGTLGLEFALCFLIWIKEFRYPLLIAGAIFHLSLDWTMVIPLFQYIMLSCYVCFIDARDLNKILDAVRRPVRAFAGAALPTTAVVRPLAAKLLRRFYPSSRK